MDFGLLKCNPLSVTEAIEATDLDNQHVAVHGILFLGEGCEENEFLLLPKNSPFDGVEPIPMPACLDRSKCLLIDQPNLKTRLGKRGVVGAFIWKDDAIIIGQIRRRPASQHPVQIGELWLMLLQTWYDLGLGPSHTLRVVAFPENRLPKLPWDGFNADRYLVPVISLVPPD